MNANVVKERRKHKREICNANLNILHPETKHLQLAVTYDVSETGIRVVTNSKLIQGEKYLIQIANIKLEARVIYEEKRRSSMMAETIAFYHGMHFTKPISPELKQKLINLGQVVWKR